MAERQVRIVITAADETAKAFSKIRGRFGSMSTDLIALGRTLTWRVTLPLVGLFTLATKAAIDYESAFVGVIKTTEGLGDSIWDLTEAGAALYRGFRDLSLEIPVAATELAKIGEIAGQLGIAADDIMEFTAVIAAIGVTTDLSTEEAATAFARLANIMQMPIQEVERLASTFVHLGNNIAATESELVDIALRIAGVGHVVGLTEPDVLGWAAAMKSVGLNAELGGSALSRVLARLAELAAEGSDALAPFAEVAGLTADAFLRLWETDPSQAMLAFITGLGGLDEAGGSAILTLNDLELGQIRVRDTLLRLAGAAPQVAEALVLANTGWLENTALMTEAERRYMTVASQLTIFKNLLTEIALTFGEVLMPLLVQFMQGTLLPLVEGLAGLDLETQRWILGLLAVAAAAGPILTIGGALLTLVGALTTPVGLLAAAAVGLGVAFVQASGGTEVAITKLREMGVAITDELTPILQRFKTWNDVNWPLIEQTNVGAATTIDTVWRAVWPKLEQFFLDSWTSIKIAFTGALDMMLSLFKLAMLALSGDWEGAWTEMGNLTENQVLTMQTLIASWLNAILHLFNTDLFSLWMATRRWFFGIYNTINDTLRNAFGIVRSWWSQIFNTSVSRVTELWEKIREVGADIYEALVRPFREAKEFITKLHIPVPHVSVSWKAGPLGISIPKFSIKWYGQGLDAIFSSPTMIGVGERGAERVQVTPLGRGGGGGAGEGAPQYQIIVNAPTGNAQDTVARMLDALKMLEMGTVPA